MIIYNDNYDCNYSNSGHVRDDFLLSDAPERISRPFLNFSFQWNTVVGDYL